MPLKSEYAQQILSLGRNDPTMDNENDDTEIATFEKPSDVDLSKEPKSANLNNPNQLKLY